MQPFKKTHLCVLKKYLAVAALSCAASVISVKSIADPKNLDIELTAQVPEKEFKLEEKKIELAMTADTTKEIFTGETDIRYLNAEKVQSLKVKLINHLPQLILLKDGERVLTDNISIGSILINNQQLVNIESGANFNQNDLKSFDQKGIHLKITSESYENAPEGKYEGTVTLQFDATIS
ncbi:hypothetical protein [Candidatus Hamiltonella endosymbiont of Tuberolachnus salignus]|uniref:hypothetical protein n=1 Tax=Candidatus Williamhamiltonella endosymbiont of Tuberolachnus salignus TaxID=3077954 RepID=UPI0030CFB541